METYTENRKAFLQRAAFDIDNLSYNMRLCKHATSDTDKVFYIQRMRDDIRKIEGHLDKAIGESE
jgi:hypothetical protein